MRGASEVFRSRTMDVLKIAFLSSAILEFFTSISIALTAVYFGFAFIGEINIGDYGLGVTLMAGLFILIQRLSFINHFGIWALSITQNNKRLEPPIA